MARLAVADIEDREDRKHRKESRKRRVKLDFGAFDEDDACPPLLHKKVQRVDARRNDFGSGVIQRGFASTQEPRLVRWENETPGGGAAIGLDSGLTSTPRIGAPIGLPEYDSDEPVLVEDPRVRLQELERLRPQASALLSKYEQRHIHELFLSVEENCRFRLYLYALAHGLADVWPEEPLMTAVLKQLTGSLDKVERTSVLKPQIPESKFDVVRRTRRIDVPPLVLRRLNGSGR